MALAGGDRMAIITDAVARGRNGFPLAHGWGADMARPLRFLTSRAAAAVVCAAGGILMALLVYLWGDMPVGVQNAVFFLVVIPFAAGVGALMGLVLRRPGAGGWAFAAVFLGTLVGHLAHAVLVDSRVYPWGPYDWEDVELTSVLNSLLVGAPAGALAYAVGLLRGREAPSTAVSVGALVLGIAPMLLGLVMMPVAIAEWAMGSPSTFLLVGIVLGSGVSLILGGVWTWRRRRGASGASGSPGGPGPERPPPPAP